MKLYLNAKKWLRTIFAYDQESRKEFISSCTIWIPDRQKSSRPAWSTSPVEPKVTHRETLSGKQNK